MRVLIDGYNLKNPFGSGIKYYGIKIIELLIKNGYDVSTLFDFKLESTNLKVIASEFYKYLNIENKDKKSKVALLKILLSKKSLQEIKLDGLEILDKDRYLTECKIYNLSNIFTKSLIKQKFHIQENIELNKKIDIFHATYPLNINIKKSKKITTIHDIIPLKLPYVSLENKQFFYDLIKSSIESSDKIITISETSKKDILEFFDVKEDKIVNTYQSVYIPDINYTLDESSLKKFNLQKQQYLLFVGNIEPKKNLGRVLEAFRKIDTNIKLVIVGKKAWMWENELRYFDDKSMMLLPFLSRDDLLLLYSNAKAFIFPSLYEGFGLPPLEAMACKCPVITSNISSLPEVCGDATIYCEPYDINSIAKAIEKALNLTETEREELIQKGLKRVAYFNDDDYFKRVKSVYESVL
ncbi:glycosyltransferase family 4 protein [Caminibacter sp.]